MESKRAVVLWTGGKDCNLALHEAVHEGYEVVSLVSFVWGGRRFKAHPFEIIGAQSDALGIPHQFLAITEPLDAGYEAALRELQNKYDIDTVITGDISEIGGHPNWIEQRCANCGIKVFAPLWHRQRESCLSKLLALRFEVIFSFVTDPFFSVGWLGKTLDRPMAGELMKLHLSKGLDICGEEGEYHTMVLDGPLYRKRVVLKSFTEKAHGLYRYMDAVQVTGVDKGHFRQ